MADEEFRRMAKGDPRLEQFKKDHTVMLDGELVARNPHRRPAYFSSLRTRIRSGGPGPRQTNVNV